MRFKVILELDVPMRSAIGNRGHNIEGEWNAVEGYLNDLGSWEYALSGEYNGPRVDVVSATVTKESK